MAKTGKIFKESSNVYQDEAKVLFDYYRNCAEKIVSEEERLEKEIASLEADREVVQARLEGWKNKVLNFIWPPRKKGILKQLEAIDNKIEQVRQAHANIFRDYRVTKLGVAYVPVAEQIKYEDKSFIVDYAGNVDNSKVTLQMPRQNQLLGNTIQNVALLADNVPLVDTTKEVETIDTNQYSLSIQEMKEGDYNGQLDRSLRTISYCMSDLETSSVELPLVPEGSDYLHYLEEYSTSEIPAKAPVVKVFDKERYDKSVKKFQDLNHLKDSLSNETNQFEQVLQNLMTTLARTVQTISSKKLATTNKLINRSNFMLYQILKSPYNHYSPILEAAEIRRIREEKFDYSDNVQGYDPFQLRQSSRVRYNILTGDWVAEDGSTVQVPFGIHQIYEEIVAPVVQNLMQENRIERLKIYNHIHDQKVSYVNKWHQDVDAFYRSNHAESADIINNMQKTLSEYVEAYNILAQLEKTVKGMEDVENEEGASLDATIVKNEDNSEDTLAAFELQAQEFRKVQEEFTDFMDRLQADINAKAEEFAHVEYYDARLRDGYSNKMAVASAEVADLDDRRKKLAQSNPLLAKETDLPPTPSVEELTYEQLSLNLPSLAQNALEELDSMTGLPSSPGPQAPLPPTTPPTNPQGPKPTPPAVDDEPAMPTPPPVDEPVMPTPPPVDEPVMPTPPPVEEDVVVTPPAVEEEPAMPTPPPVDEEVVVTPPPVVEEPVMPTPPPVEEEPAMPTPPPVDEPAMPTPPPVDEPAMPTPPPMDEPAMPTPPPMDEPAQPATPQSPAAALSGLMKKKGGSLLGNVSNGDDLVNQAQSSVSSLVKNFKNKKNKKH